MEMKEEDSHTLHKFNNFWFLFFPRSMVDEIYSSFCSAGKKKLPIMLINWQPVLGRGTSQTAGLPEEEQVAGQRLNMLLWLQLETNLDIPIFNTSIRATERS